MALLWDDGDGVHLDEDEQRLVVETIAEFVENESILEALRRLDVDYAQGYHIGEPISLEAVCFGEKGRSLADTRIASLAH